MEYFCFKTNKSLFRRDETDAHMAFELLKNKQKRKRFKMPKAGKQARLMRIGKK